MGETVPVVEFEKTTDSIYAFDCDFNCDWVEAGQLILAALPDSAVESIERERTPVDWQNTHHANYIKLVEACLNNNDQRLARQSCRPFQRVSQLSQDLYIYL